MKTKIALTLLAAGYWLLAAPFAFAGPSGPGTCASNGAPSFSCPNPGTPDACGSGGAFSCLAAPSCAANQRNNCASPTCACVCDPGLILCGAICQAPIGGSCAPGQTLDQCTGLCVGNAYAILNPASVQTGNLNITGSYQVNGVAIGGGGGISGGIADRVPKYTGATTLGLSSIYDVGGLIGIGNGTPAYKLDILEFGTTPVIRISNQNVTKYSTGLLLARSITDKWSVGMNNVDDDFRIRRNGTIDELVINSQFGSGVGVPTALGVGKTTPSYKLDVRGSGGAATIRIEDGVAAPGGKTGIQMDRTGSVEKWFMGMLAADDKFRIGRTSYFDSLTMDIVGGFPRVGINTGAPVATLHVAGNGQFDSKLTVANATGNAIVASSAIGTGVYATGANEAMYAQSSSVGGYGIDAYSNGGFGVRGYGAYGLYGSGSSMGVWGSSTAGSGVEGWGGPTGVYGQSSGSGGTYGGFFDGGASGIGMHGEGFIGAEITGTSAAQALLVTGAGDGARIESGAGGTATGALIRGGTALGGTGLHVDRGYVGLDVEGGTRAGLFDNGKSTVGIADGVSANGYGIHIDTLDPAYMALQVIGNATGLLARFRNTASTAIIDFIDGTGKGMSITTTDAVYLPLEVKGANAGNVATFRNTSATGLGGINFVGGGAGAPTAQIGAAGATAAAPLANLTYFGSSGDMTLLTANTRRLTVTAAGNVGIGTTAPANLLHVAGNIRIGTGTTGCVYDADATILTGTCSSDVRLKKNVEPLVGALQVVAGLRPVTFNWRSEEYPERFMGTEEQIGLVAQDVEKVAPSLVGIGDDGFKTVDFSALQFYLIGAIKEQQKQIESLEARVKALEN